MGTYIALLDGKVCLVDLLDEGDEGRSGERIGAQYGRFVAEGVGVLLVEVAGLAAQRLNGADELDYRIVLRGEVRKTLVPLVALLRAG